jgi:hypothetical protein
MCQLLLKPRCLQVDRGREHLNKRGSKWDTDSQHGTQDNDAAPQPIPSSWRIWRGRLGSF